MQCEQLKLPAVLLHLSFCLTHSIYVQYAYTYWFITQFENSVVNTYHEYAQCRVIILLLLRQKEIDYLHY